MTTTDERAGSMRGRVALITGASSGIGRSYAHALSAEGAELVLVGRSEERLRTVADALPGPSRIVAGDVSDAAVSEEAVRVALAEFDRLDDVLANAGLYTGGDFVDTDPATIEQLVSVNVFGAMATVRAALPHLIAAGTGDVLVTSSVSGTRTSTGNPSTPPLSTPCNRSCTPSGASSSAQACVPEPWHRASC